MSFYMCDLITTVRNMSEEEALKYALEVGKLEGNVFRRVLEEATGVLDDLVLCDLLNIETRKPCGRRAWDKAFTLAYMHRGLRC